jgi:hypothetical protein
MTHFVSNGPITSCLLSVARCSTVRPMSREEKIVRRSALLSFRFLFTAALGSVLMGLVVAFGTLPTQLAMLGCFISIVGGLFLAYLGQEDERERQRNAAIESLSAPLTLASDPELFRLYRSLCEGLTAVARQPQGILRDASIQKLSSVAEQVAGLAVGKMVFAQTEGWRTVYERLLLSPGLRAYRSVAWVQTLGYWQDSPGQQSMRVNFDAVARGVSIERMVILPDHLWRARAMLPAPEILPWIEKQHDHGLRVTLVRESEAAREPDLLADVGIYGTWAVGLQELDEHSRTLRFTLHIDPQAVRAAEDRWRRLALYAVPFENLRDQIARAK